MRRIEKVYFPNLNGLRFIAAFLVIIHHLDQLLFIFHKPNQWDNPVILLIGGLGVTLFFVLSGFLITYLLLSEEKSTGTISIKDFYIRRILRIWPLYYTIILLCFFVFQHIDVLALPELMNGINQHFWFYFLLFLLFLPNLALHGYGVVLPYGSQSWSVGVEEQFYLIWPILMKLVKNRIVLILGVIIGYFFIRYFGFRIVKHFVGQNYALELFRNFFNSFQIYSMATGALFAYFSFHKTKFVEKYILNLYTFFITLILTVVLILTAFKISTFLYSILFGVIIYNLACNDRLKKFLEMEILNYLGKISYGLYMYHPLAIVIVIRTFDYFEIINSKILLLLCSTLLTVFIAGISYRFMERRFIKLKTKYSKVISGDNVKNKF